MAKYGSIQFQIFLVSGYDLRASLIESGSIAHEANCQQTNPFGATSEQNTPTGLDKATLTVGGGLFDPVTDALHAALNGVLGIQRIVCVGIEGNVPGARFSGYGGVIDTKYEAMATNGQLTKANVTYQVSATQDAGEIVQPLSTFTASWDTKTGGAGSPDMPVDTSAGDEPLTHNITSNTAANPTVVTTPVAHGLTSGDIILISGVLSSSPTINGQRVVTVTSPTTFTVPVSVSTPGTVGSFVRVNTFGGGVGYQQVTAYTGFTGFVGILQDSPDDVTYTDLVVFADLGSVHTPSAQRLGALDQTVDRFLAYKGTVAGSGSITVFAGFCRGALV